MKVQGKDTRSIWLASDGWSVNIIDQRQLPAKLVVARLQSLEEVAIAIRDMWIRGAPLIGVNAAYGMCLAMRADPSDSALSDAYETLLRCRPTAVNLRWALDRMKDALLACPQGERVQVAYSLASEMADEDVDCCSRIGDHGLPILKALSESKEGPLHILTHCNAGWLATVDWGTALAPIYKAHDAGIDVHVYVDETRPRNQGASLTTWELSQHGVPHTLIVDNAGGQLMQKGRIDMCIVGSDRTTSNGDVCNKIGTYLKALAAHDNQVPFYVALPYSTIDWTLDDGLTQIPIEERDPREVTHLRGVDETGVWREIALCPDGSAALNPGFDVTPARLVTGIITERGVCRANAKELKLLYPS